MLTHPTLEQMQALGLKGMAAAYHDLAELDQTEDLSREDWLALMLDREAATRADKRLANRLRAAKLRFSEACIEEISTSPPSAASIAVTSSRSPPAPGSRPTRT